METFKSPEERNLDLIKERVHKLKQFYIHAFIYVFGVIVYIAKTYFGAPLNFYPLCYLNEFVMWCWTFIIVIQGLQLLLMNTLLSSKWEQKKIEKLLKKQHYGK